VVFGASAILRFHSKVDGGKRVRYGGPKRSVVAVTRMPGPRTRTKSPWEDQGMQKQAGGVVGGPPEKTKTSVSVLPLAPGQQRNVPQRVLLMPVRPLPWCCSPSTSLLSCLNPSSLILLQHRSMAETMPAARPRQARPTSHHPLFLVVLLLLVSPSLLSAFILPSPAAPTILTTRATHQDHNDAHSRHAFLSSSSATLFPFLLLSSLPSPSLALVKGNAPPKDMRKKSGGKPATANMDEAIELGRKKVREDGREGGRKAEV